MKWWNSAFNSTQGSRVFIVLVQVGAVKIFPGRGGAQAKGKTGWNSVYHQKYFGGKFSLGPSYFD
jgi:hypothetical protein